MDRRNAARQKRMEEELAVIRYPTVGESLDQQYDPGSPPAG